MRSKEEIVAEAGHAQDVAARDDAHLRSLGIFEFMLGIVVLVGVVYYLVADRGDVTSTSLEPDLATGEAVIG